MSFGIEFYVGVTAVRASFAAVSQLLCLLWVVLDVRVLQREARSALLRTVIGCVLVRDRSCDVGRAGVILRILLLRRPFLCKRAGR